MPRTSTLLAVTALTAAAGLAGAAPALAAPQVRDVDAELLPGNRLHLQAETSGARRIWFTVSGRTVRGRLSEIDRDDRTREWDRVIAARGVGTGPRDVRVRACGGGRCDTRTVRVFVERDD